LRQDANAAIIEFGGTIIVVVRVPLKLSGLLRLNDGRRDS
jgi:hypothetical protein